MCRMRVQRQSIEPILVILGDHEEGRRNLVCFLGSDYLTDRRFHVVLPCTLRLPYEDLS